MDQLVLIKKNYSGVGQPALLEGIENYDPMSKDHQ